MNDKPPCSKWVGVVLSVLLNGSAHFLSGEYATSLKWYFGLLASGILTIVFLATPGTVPYILGVASGLGGLILWFVMVRQSYRPVRRIGLSGWFAVVALAIALGYGQQTLLRQFIHPFKVPACSMQPTIFGVHAQNASADSTHRPGVLQWLLTGKRFEEVRATTDGVLSLPVQDTQHPTKWNYTVGSRAYPIPRYERPLKQPGERVSAGELLWSGTVTSGDRLFAEKLSYIFGKPQRGDIVVFRTDGIQTLRPESLYVKRIAGLPGDRIRIDPPFLVVNDQKVTAPEMFQKISNKLDGYAGFQLATGAGPIGGLLTQTTDEVKLGSDEYFVLGDNTLNSRDSRYWGAVPGSNIIGKVTRIYWPFTRINALEGKR